MIYRRKIRRAPQMKISPGYRLDDSLSSARLHQSLFKIKKPRSMIRARGRHEAAKSWKYRYETLGGDSRQKREQGSFCSISDLWHPIVQALSNRCQKCTAAKFDSAPNSRLPDVARIVRHA